MLKVIVFSIFFFLLGFLCGATALVIFGTIAKSNMKNNDDD